MSENKSLGSSPIGYKSKKDSTMGFIPDLGVSQSPKEKPAAEKKVTNSSKESSGSSQKKKTEEKKVVSYSLEASLIDDIKATATDREMYYSTLVSKVLKKWLAENT